MKKKTIYLNATVCIAISLLITLSLTSCEKEISTPVEKPVEQPEEQPSEEELLARERQMIIDTLCFNGKYVKRAFEEARSGGYDYEYVISQKDYYFSADGTGIVMEYQMNDTDRGYRDYVDSITWILSDIKPFTLMIKEKKEENYAMFFDLKVTDFGLSFQNENWTREIDLYDGFKKEDVLSYKVTHLHTFTKMSNLYDTPLLCITPTTLTVQTEKGTLRYIRNHVATYTLGYYCWEDCNVYFTINPRLNNFYSVRTDVHLGFCNDSEPNWVEYNFYVGYVDQGWIPNMIENGVEYKIEY